MLQRRGPRSAGRSHHAALCVFQSHRLGWPRRTPVGDSRVVPRACRKRGVRVGSGRIPLWASALVISWCWWIVFWQTAVSELGSTRAASKRAEIPAAGRFAPRVSCGVYVARPDAPSRDRGTPRAVRRRAATLAADARVVR
jgi:hypothetical protein